MDDIIFVDPSQLKSLVKGRQRPKRCDVSAQNHSSESGIWQTSNAVRTNDQAASDVAHNEDIASSSTLPRESRCEMHLDDADAHGRLYEGHQASVYDEFCLADELAAGDSSGDLDSLFPSPGLNVDVEDSENIDMASRDPPAVAGLATIEIDAGEEPGIHVGRRTYSQQVYTPSLEGPDVAALHGCIPASETEKTSRGGFSRPELTVREHPSARTQAYKQGPCMLHLGTAKGGFFEEPQPAAQVSNPDPIEAGLRYEDMNTLPHHHHASDSGETTGSFPRSTIEGSRVYGMNTENVIMAAGLVSDLNARRSSTERGPASGLDPNTGRQAAGAPNLKLDHRSQGKGLGFEYQSSGTIDTCRSQPPKRALELSVAAEVLPTAQRRRRWMEPVEGESWHLGDSTRCGSRGNGQDPSQLPVTCSDAGDIRQAHGSVDGERVPNFQGQAPDCHLPSQIPEKPTAIKDLTVLPLLQGELALLIAIIRDPADVWKLTSSPTAWGLTDDSFAARISNVTIKVLDHGFCVVTALLAGYHSMTTPAPHKSSGEGVSQSNTKGSNARPTPDKDQIRMKRGKWTSSEDACLRKWVHEGQPWDWIIRQFPDRPGGAIRSRWNVVLKGA